MNGEKLDKKEFHLKGSEISKYYDEGRYILKNISVGLKNGQIIGITGENGSGKTTLLKILSGVAAPTSGKVELFVNGSEVSYEYIFRHLGYISPYLNIYEEFTPTEHIRLFLKLQNKKLTNTEIEALLEEFRLYTRKDDLIRTFSSGMKQRMKYILALINEPDILFLDEPFTNLDQDGIEIVRSVVSKHVSMNGSVIIASNDEREKSICTEIINLPKLIY